MSDDDPRQAKESDEIEWDGRIEQDNLENGELGIIRVDERDASNFLATIAGYEIDGTPLQLVLSKLVFAGYRLGFRHGLEGFPPNVIEYEKCSDSVEDCGTIKDFFRKK